MKTADTPTNKMTPETLELLRQSGVMEIRNFVVASKEVSRLREAVKHALFGQGLIEKSTFRVFEDAVECSREAAEVTDEGVVAFFWTVAPTSKANDVLLETNVNGTSGFLSLDVIVGPTEIPQPTEANPHLIALTKAFCTQSILLLFARPNTSGVKLITSD